jgi:hypothetical protein
MISERIDACCANCAYFTDDARALESAIAGLRSFGSGFASVRGEDGLCSRHERYIGARSHCPGHVPRRASDRLSPFR